jgi:uncharacterized SAM-binding protein YcdF (DUF218 family)
MGAGVLYLYLSKILPLMVLPIGIAIELCLLALIYIRKDRGRAAGFLVFFAVVVLWGSSMPLVGNAVMGRLERTYPPARLREVPVSKCLVLLGGAVDPIAPPREEVELNEGADRVREAALLYNVAKVQTIIASGGKQPWSPYEESEARAMRTLLLEWGVPKGMVVIEEKSRNTRENAVNTIEMLQHMDCGTPLLVTSAAHMKRAVGAFAVLGQKVIPVPVDVRAINAGDLMWKDFLPTVDGLKMTTDAVREWIGRKVYEMRGWN